MPYTGQIRRCQAPDLSCSPERRATSPLGDSPDATKFSILLKCAWQHWLSRCCSDSSWVRTRPPKHPSTHGSIEIERLIKFSGWNPPQVFRINQPQVHPIGGEPAKRWPCRTKMTSNEDPRCVVIDSRRSPAIRACARSSKYRTACNCWANETGRFACTQTLTPLFITKSSIGYWWF
jgi:hypothetical protein